jgi:uncharacterized membrane protein
MRPSLPAAAGSANFAAVSLRAIACYLLALFMASTGVLHFVTPAFFISIVPAYVPYPAAMVAISGACEIAGGLGLLSSRTRRMAGIGLVVLFIAVFPANINQAIHHLPLNGKPVAPPLLWARLFLQPVFIAWAWWAAIKQRATAR